VAALASGCEISIGGGGFSMGAGHVQSLSSTSAFHAERDAEHALELAPGERLVLTDFHGDVEVLVSEEAAPHIATHWRIGGPTREEAERWADGVALAFTRADGELRLALDGSVPRPAQMSIGGRHRLTIPRDVALEIGAVQSDVSIVGPVRAAAVTTTYGDVRIVDCGGELSAESSSGDVVVERARADRVTLRSVYGDVSLRDVRCDALRAETSSGNLEASDLVAGTAELTTTYGGVELEGIAASLRATSSSGTVRGRRLEGERLALTTIYGNVEVERSDGSLVASSGSGDVDVDSHTGDAEVTSTYGNVELAGALGRVRAETASGDVEVALAAEAAVTGPWTVRARHGDATVTLPRAAACEVVVHARPKHLRSDFEELRSSDDTASRVAARLGAGGERIEVSSALGDVAILRR
jgi:hypothetical protein